MNTREGYNHKLLANKATDQLTFKQYGNHYARNFTFWECDKLSQQDAGNITMSVAIDLMQAPPIRKSN